MDRILLLNTAYFPPIQYLSKIRHYRNTHIEQYEHYGKQSYRNRCCILSANGLMTLSVPIQKSTGQKFLTKEAKIDYSTRWQKLHFKSIESAYRNSPFYDYYIEEFTDIFQKEEKYLLDLNTRILEILLPLFGLERKLHFTSDYVRNEGNYEDMRNTIHPKPAHRESEDMEFRSIPYTQTFNDRFPFFPNLSSIDLLFNTGPEAPDYL